MLKNLLLVILVLVAKLSLSSSSSSVFYEEGCIDQSLFPSCLIAKCDDRDYVVIQSSDTLCLSLIDQGDYDNNGVNDALVKIIYSCGSAGYPNQFLVVTMRNAGFFISSDTFGNSWGDPLIEKRQSSTTFKILDAYEDSDYCNINVQEKIFVYENFNVKIIETSTKRDLLALKELRSCSFLETNSYDDKYIEFDIDGDNKLDLFTFSYWERWGRMIWSLNSTKHGIITSNSGCKRLGILKSKTNGMMDLVIDSDDVLKWNGTSYVE